MMMMMMEAVRISETSIDNYFAQQYIPEDNSEHHLCGVIAFLDSMQTSCEKCSGL
jgi:hypothetical protein